MAVVAIIQDEAWPVVLHPGPGLADGRAVAIADDRLTVGDRSWPVVVARDGERVWVHFEGRAHELIVRDAVDHLAQTADGGGADDIRAPMPGVVIQRLVEPGQDVAAADVVMVIESMKLETSIRAGRAGVVAAVHVVAGQTFERDATLVTLVAEA